MSKGGYSSKFGLRNSVNTARVFVTNQFGRHFSYYNKHIKSQLPPVHHKIDGPLVSMRSLRSVSPASSVSSIDFTPRMMHSFRSGSSSNIRSNVSIASITLDRQKLSLKNRFRHFK